MDVVSTDAARVSPAAEPLPADLDGGEGRADGGARLTFGHDRVFIDPEPQRLAVDLSRADAVKLRDQLLKLYPLDPTWPAHDSGRPKNIGEMSSAERRGVFAEAVKAVGDDIRRGVFAEAVKAVGDDICRGGIATHGGYIWREVRADMTDEAAIRRRMGADVLDLFQTRGLVTERALVCLGWTQAQVIRFAEPARSEMQRLAAARNAELARAAAEA